MIFVRNIFRPSAECHYAVASTHNSNASLSVIQCSLCLRFNETLSFEHLSIRTYVCWSFLIAYSSLPMSCHCLPLLRRFRYRSIWQLFENWKHEKWFKCPLNEKTLLNIRVRNTLIIIEFNGHLGFSIIIIIIAVYPMRMEKFRSIWSSEVALHFLIGEWKFVFVGKKKINENSISLRYVTEYINKKKFKFSSFTFSSVWAASLR